MDPAWAAPVAGSADILAAPRTPASSPPSAGRSRSVAPLPADDPLYINCSSYLCVQFHPLHPSAHLCRSLANGLLLPDFYSGATGLSGCFSEGFCLRCSQEPHAGPEAYVRALRVLFFTERLPDIARYEGLSVLSRGVLTGSPRQGLGNRCRSFADRCHTCSEANSPYPYRSHNQRIR